MVSKMYNTRNESAMEVPRLVRGEGDEIAI